MIKPNQRTEALDYINQADEKAIVFHDLDDAILGLNQHGELIYGHGEMVDIFMEDHMMSQEEAIEWIDYNVIGVNGGQGFQVLFV
jgi:hypothetical protein